MKKIFTILSVAVFCALNLQAQSSLNVIKTDGSSYVIPLEEFDRAVFDDSEPTLPEVVLDTINIHDTTVVEVHDTLVYPEYKQLFFYNGTTDYLPMTQIDTHIWKLNYEFPATMLRWRIVDSKESEQTPWGGNKNPMQKGSWTFMFTNEEGLHSIVFNDMTGKYDLSLVEKNIVEIHDTITSVKTDTITLVKRDTVKIDAQKVEPLVFKNDKGEICYRVSFEDSDQLMELTGSLSTGEEPKKWSDLIDSEQYGGTLLYGSDGNGTDGSYTFVDQMSGLMSGFQGEFTGADLTYGNAFWSGGLAVSNYYNSSAENGGYTTQLEVYSETENGGANGSSNFLMSFGYNDVEQTAVSYDSRPYIGNMYGDFTIQSLYVNNSTYLLHSVGYGDQFNSSATEETQVMFVLEGYKDVDEEQSAGSVVFYLVKDGVPVTEWTKVDCSALGKCDHFRINITASEDQSGPYGLNVPAFVAIDDIVISK